MQPRLASTRSLAFLFTIVAFLLQATSARAATIVEVEAVSAAPGSSGNSFDVVLENTGPSAVTVAGFSFGLTSSSNVTFTDVTTATAPTTPYIFNGHSEFGPDIVLSAGAGAVSASDNYLPANAGFSVAANSTVGLGHVLFNVAPAASGVIAVNIQAFPDTGINDPNGINILFIHDRLNPRLDHRSLRFPSPRSWR